MTLIHLEQMKAWKRACHLEMHLVQNWVQQMGQLMDWPMENCWELSWE
jgi:hypothetical protein